MIDKYHRFFPDIKHLYDYQHVVLKLLQNKASTLAIIPTGGGKSLIFQLMALELPGITLVISPLLALMAEQTAELNKRGIPAMALNADMPFNDQRVALRNLTTASCRLLYVSAERLQNPLFRSALAASGVQISMIVVDEAHCVSQWGNGFRPDYSQIPGFKEFLFALGQQPFFFCLTATLSQPARQDIVREFAIHEEQVYISPSIIRSNLALEYMQVAVETDKVPEIKRFLEVHQPQKILVYLYSRKKCETLANDFSTCYPTAYFHSDMEGSEKESVYTRFRNGQVQMLFATTAFGMGINIPDIDCIIHYHIPNSAEEYYQQAGRGWRKKTELRTCHCMALWSDKNFKERQRDITSDYYDTEKFDRHCALLLPANAAAKPIGFIFNKDKESLMKASANLQLLRYILEKHGIIKTIGEINGGPQDIELANATSLWTQLQQAAEIVGNSFILSSKLSGIMLPAVIEHLYEQEYKGNINKLPALKRDVYFELLTPEIPAGNKESIINELNTHVDSRLQQLTALQQLFLSGEPEALLTKLLAGS